MVSVVRVPSDVTFVCAATAARPLLSIALVVPAYNSLTAVSAYAVSVIVGSASPPELVVVADTNLSCDSSQNNAALFDEPLFTIKPPSHNGEPVTPLPKTIIESSI